MDKITLPKFEITLSEQEIEALNPGQQAMAKDWHLVNKKLDWIVNQTVRNQNDIVEHDDILETHRTLVRIFRYVIPITSGVLLLIAGGIKLVKYLWGTIKP